MAEGFISEELIILLKEKYLFSHIPPSFMEIDDGSLVFIYMRILTIYDDVNQLVTVEENFHDTSISNLRHILRCLRHLGLSYLAPNTKDLLDKKKAARIITALHDKISSKYGVTFSQRVRQVIKKEKLSRTNQRHQKPVNQVEDHTALRKPTDLNSEEEYQLPVERKIPKGRQIPRTPLKIDQNQMSVIEDACKQPVVMPPPLPLPPPPLFEDSPPKRVCSNLQNASAYILTPPSDFRDNSFSKHAMEFSERPVTSKSSYENVIINGSNCVSYIEKPIEESFSNKRLTYCKNDDLEHSSVSYSSSETSLEENVMIEKNASCYKKQEKCISNFAPQFVNENSFSSVDDKLCTQDEKTSPIIANESSCVVKGNHQHALIDKRRTYCVPKISNIAESNKENITENSEVDLLQDKNKRRTYVIEPNYKYYQVEHDEDREENVGMEDVLKEKNKRRTYVIQHDKESKIHLTTEEEDEKIADNENDLDNTVNDLNSTFNSTALYIDIKKGDVSFIERGKKVFPRGKELLRTPPSLTSSFDYSQQFEKLDKIGTTANKFITIPETNTRPSDVYYADEISSKGPSQDATFVKSKDNSFVFDDSYALFPSKMESNRKIASENKFDDTIVNSITSSPKLASCKDDDYSITSSPKLASCKDDDYNDIDFEKNEANKQLRKVISKGISKDQNLEETETKNEEENTENQIEKINQKGVSKNKLVSEVTEREVSNIQCTSGENLDIKGKKKYTRTNRKVRNEIIELIKEEEEVTEGQTKTLDSENCKPKLSESKNKFKENAELQLLKDFESMDLQLKKKRGPKPKLKLNCKDVKFESNVNRIVSVEENINYQQSENQNTSKPPIKKKPGPKPKNKDLNLENSKDLKKNTNEIATIEEKMDFKEARLEPDSVKQVETENEDPSLSTIKVSDTTKTKMKSGRKTSKLAEVLNINQLKHTLVENRSTEENQPSGEEENLNQKGKQVRKNKTSKVTLMIEKFNNIQLDAEDVHSKTKTRRKVNPEFENKGKKLVSDAFGTNTEDGKSAAKTKYRKKSETDCKEDITNNAPKKENKEVSSKPKGRQTKKLEIDNDKENVNNAVLLEDQEAKPKAKPKRKKSEIEEINKNIVPNKQTNVSKKPLLEVDENNEVNKRPSRKCKSYAKLAITDMLNSP